MVTALCLGDKVLGLILVISAVTLVDAVAG